MAKICGNQFVAIDVFMYGGNGIPYILFVGLLLKIPGTYDFLFSLGYS